jgi:hypothetical protein
MSDSERVVIRSSWLAVLANVAPIAAILVASQFWVRSLGGAVAGLVVLTTLTVVFRSLNYVELTPEGLGIHWFRMERMPWQRIGSVDRVGSLGTYELKIFDLALHISRRLPAPRGAFGVGRKETAEARNLVEAWWLAHGGTLHRAPARSATPRDASGGLVDPWVPPPPA